MAVKSYFCPVCGTEHTTITNLWKCVDTHKQEEVETERKAAQEALIKKKELIKTKYEELKTLINDFNDTSTEKEFCCSLNTLKKLKIESKDYAPELSKEKLREMFDSMKKGDYVFGTPANEKVKIETKAITDLIEELFGGFDD